MTGTLTAALHRNALTSIPYSILSRAAGHKFAVNNQTHPLLSFHLGMKFPQRMTVPSEMFKPTPADEDMVINGAKSQFREWCNFFKRLQSQIIDGRPKLYKSDFS